MIGQAVRRAEDKRFITGRGTYTDDIRLPGLLSAVFVRSPLPSARITRLDAGEALSVPGVRHVLTARELAGHVRAIPLIRRPPNADRLPSIGWSRPISSTTGFRRSSRNCWTSRKRPPCMPST